MKRPRIEASDVAWGSASLRDLPSVLNLPVPITTEEDTLTGQPSATDWHSPLRRRTSEFSRAHNHAPRKPSPAIFSLEPAGPAVGFERTFLEPPTAARLFVRLARRTGRIGDAAGGIARRLLVAGPPGAGKASLARAIAGELQTSFAALGRETSQSPERLAAALQALDVQARVANQAAVIYFEAEATPRWAANTEQGWPDFARWLRTWAAGAHRHLYLVIGVPDARQIDPALADATLSVCTLCPPCAATRHKLWERALEHNAPMGSVTYALEAETFDKVVVRPSEGMWPGDIGDALRIAMRTAILSHPDATTIALSADDLRGGIRHVQARRMDASAMQLQSLSIY